MLPPLQAPGTVGAILGTMPLAVFAFIGKRLCCTP